jgi:membrane protein implicated in regulation of membrane protease activity
MEDWLVWFLGAVALVVAEMFTPGFWLACLGVGAVAAGIVALVPGLGPAVQGIAFAATSLASMIGLRPVMVRRFQLGAGSGVRTGVDALLGKRGVVLERIDRASRLGRVKVDGEDWRGASVDDTPIEVGTWVTVIQVDGTTLVVEKES